MEQIQAVTKVMPYIATALFFIFIVVVSISYHPGRNIVKAYHRVNNRLREHSTGLFQYEKILKFLQANGAAHHFGTWIEPIKFIIMRSAVSIIFFILALRLGWFMAFAAAALGFQAPVILLIYLNKQDNYNMLPQIQTLYSTLTVQIKAGVYVTDAMAECYRGMEKGRIRTALEEFSGELYMKNSFDDCVQNFNSKFSNGFIDSLCIILLQAQESGKAVELLHDMTEQLKDMKEIALLRKKEKLERTSTFCVLGEIAVAMVIIIYACLISMMNTASRL